MKQQTITPSEYLVYIQEDGEVFKVEASSLESAKEIYRNNAMHLPTILLAGDPSYNGRIDPRIYQTQGTC